MTLVLGVTWDEALCDNYKVWNGWFTIGDAFMLTL